MFREREREVSGLAGLGKRAAGLQLCVVIYLLHARETIVCETPAMCGRSQCIFIRYLI